MLAQVIALREQQEAAVTDHPHFAAAVKEKKQAVDLLTAEIQRTAVHAVATTNERMNLKY